MKSVTFPSASATTAMPAGPAIVALTAGPPSPVFPHRPLPATVQMRRVLASIRRTR